jgi:serine/threonine protein kinase
MQVKIKGLIFINVIKYKIKSYKKNIIAPELLAHKKYGSKVDVWSIGVNMYAMLTGNLPFTVEPFNIKALYNKMMKNEMNAIPEHLSKNGEDLLRKLLNPDPSKRISLKEAMDHPWINEGLNFYYLFIYKSIKYAKKLINNKKNEILIKIAKKNNKLHFFYSKKVLRVF